MSRSCGFEVPRQGTWICGSNSGGAAPGYEDSDLQPTLAIHARLAKRDLAETRIARFF